jgi:hypothetical protein
VSTYIIYRMHNLKLCRLKDRLRSLILAKNVRPGIGFQALVDMNHRDADMKALKGAQNSVLASPSKRPFLGDADESSVTATKPERRTGSTDRFDGVDTNDSDSDDSLIGTTTRRCAFLETGFSGVELRLYCKLTVSTPGSLGPVFSYGRMFLTPDCTTANDCFTRVCDKIKTDCSFMIFQLPEDMSGSEHRA